ncbi:hypothetical protein [Ruminococcus sp.]
MKVSDGFWMNKKGYNVHWASQIYETEADERSVTVWATPYHVSNRGMTLGGPVLTVTFTSVLENSIKVSIEHFRGDARKKPSFVLNEDKGFRPAINRLPDGGWELISGRTSVRIGCEKGKWDISYYFDGKLLTSSGWRTTSIIEEEPWHREQTNAEQSREPFFSRSDSGESVYIREMLGLSVGEHIYGFGEKFSSFVKNGQTVEVWNSDGGTCTEQSYKSVPFFVSSRGYGVFVYHP